MLLKGALVEPATAFAIDLGSVPDWILALAAIIAAAQGWRTLSQWRREGAGRRRMELAEQVLADFYQAQHQISKVRHPIGHLTEAYQRVGRDEEDEAVREWRDMYYPTFARLEQVSPFFAGMKARQFQAQAVFGDKLDAAYDKIELVLYRVRIAAEELYEDDPSVRQPTEAGFAKHLVLRADIWWDRDDELAKEVEGAIKQVEDVLRKQVRS